MNISREHASTPRASISPSAAQIGWAAGIIEGEGSISAQQGYGSLRVTQKDPEILHTLQRLFGGTVGRYQFGGPLKRTYFTWTASGARARGVLMTVFTFLSGRRRLQARLALGVA